MSTFRPLGTIVAGIVWLHIAYSLDADLLTLSEDLYTLDQQGNSAAVNQDWAVNTRSTNGKLFTKVDTSKFQLPTYKAMIALFDNYNPTLGVAENVTELEKKEETAFLDAIMATPVMKKAFDYLKNRKLLPAAVKNETLFKEYLRMIWFTTYKRKGQPDTSGFEHTFVGEIAGSGPNDGVEGFHNWVRYAQEETAGRAKYGRWKGQTDPDLYGMQFTWNGRTKIKSTIAVGESPEMSIAVLTVCFVVAPNSACPLRMGGAPVNIQTYRWDVRGNPNEYYVASAYYDN